MNLSENLWFALRLLGNAQGTLIPAPPPVVIGRKRSRPQAAFHALVKKGLAEKRTVEGRTMFKITGPGFAEYAERSRREQL
jgi:hypothetical protein